MPKLKPLHLAKSTEDLNKLAVDVLHQLRSIKGSITVADKLYVNAKDAHLNGDEEKAYVYYMRYYYVLKNIWKDPSYKAKKTTFDRQIGPDRPGKAIEAAEKLLDSLETRYEAAAGNKSEKDDIDTKSKKQRMDPSSSTKNDKEDDECMFDSDSSLPEIPDAPSTPVEQRKFAAEQIFQNNSEQQLMPSASNNKVDNAGWFGNQTLLDFSDSKTGVMATSVVALYGQLQQKPDSVIVLDCRPCSQQKICHVDYKRFPQWIKIPEETINAGVTADSLLKMMSSQHQLLWKNRADKQIVLIDADSKPTNCTAQIPLPVMTLKDAIYKFDLTNELSHEPQLLDGGFLRWYQTYSPYCIGKVTKKVSRQHQDNTTPQVSLDYPELPKAESSTTNEASNFLTTPSGHPLQLTDNVEANSTTSTFGQPGNLTSVDTSSQSNHTTSGPTVLHGNSSHNIAASFSDRTLPQVGLLPSQSSATSMLSDIQVVPSANFTSVPAVSHNVVPNGVLPANSAVMYHTNDTSMTTPLQYPSVTAPLVHPNQNVLQENKGVYLQHDMATPMSYPQHDMATPVSYPQQDMATLVSYPQHDMATPVSYPQHDMATPVSYPQHDMATPGSYSQQDVVTPRLFPHQDIGTPVSYPPQDMVLYSQQDMNTPGSYPQQMTGPVSNPDQHLGMHPQQTGPLPSTQQDMPTLGSQPVPILSHPSQSGVPMYAPQVTPQVIPQGTQVIPPGTTLSAHQDQAVVWSHNPRVAHGPLPTPPTYEDASLMPSHPPVQPPLPPPISVPIPENGPRNAGPVALVPTPNAGHIPQPDPNNMAAQISGQPVYHQQQNVLLFDNGGQSIQGIEPIPVSHVTHGPVSTHPLIVQPVNQMQSPYASQVNRNHQPSHQSGLQTVVVQRDDKRRKQQQQAEREAVVERERQAALARERQAALEMERQAMLEMERQAALQREREAALEKERQAALEREKQEKILLEKEKEDLRRRHEELEMIMSRNTATEQQVMELRDQLQAKEKSLAAKEFEQQAMMQERLRLQEQKEKEITNIEQQLYAEKVALQQLREQQQHDLIREKEHIEQHKMAAMKELEKERDTVLLQQKQLREQQQNMNEQMTQWLQTRNQNSRQVQVETGLPVGWEKKFDQTTGRFYYQDHNTKTTHWSPPSSWLTHGNPAQPSSRQGVANQPPQQVTANVVPQPSSIPSGKIPKSTSGHIQPLAAKTKLPPTQTATDHNPSVGPSAKPVGDSGTVAVPDRSTKPQSQPTQTNRVNNDITTVNQIPPHVWKRKMENLQPVHGGSMGRCLTGMKNFGNTCFMNAIIQCLCSTVPLSIHFLTGKYRYDLNKSNPIGTGGQIAEEFNVIVRATWYGQYRSITPRDFKNTVAKYAPRFVTSEQQDSQEFLAFVTDGIHEDLNRVKVYNYTQNQDNTGVPHHVAALRAWDHHQKRNDSIIVDLFQGQFRSVVTCLTCRKQSVTFEVFMYLTVPIPPTGTRPTVEDCIKLFAKPEKMEGSDKWMCPNCKCKRDAVKRIEIWKLPQVLVIVLKRFYYHGQWRDKISKYVHYPINELNMSQYVVGDQQPSKYHLYAITNHTGTLHGGHYTACCRHPYNRNRFYKFDDQEVYEIANNKLQTAAGYVLFYSSVDFVPPKLGT